MRVNNHSRYVDIVHNFVLRFFIGVPLCLSEKMIGKDFRVSYFAFNVNNGFLEVWEVFW